MEAKRVKLGGSVQILPNNKTSDGASEVLLTQPDSQDSSKEGSAPKYGQFAILGYNGLLPPIDRGRRRSKFVLNKRSASNGVKRSKHYVVRSAQNSQSFSNAAQHLISFTLSRSQSVIVEYDRDEDVDMFQIGRSSEEPIDFVLADTIAGEKGDCRVKQSTISRFACRILADRSNPEVVKIYAAGFNSMKNIFLGEQAMKWQSSGIIDGLTTNGVLIMHPRFPFLAEEAEKDDVKENKTGEIWREVSVGGRLFQRRGNRSDQQRGIFLEGESNILQDGTLVDVCGATLIWRSGESLKKSPTKKMLQQMVDDMNTGRPQCPVGLNTLVIPRSNSVVGQGAQPYVYLKCGHVQGHHSWQRIDTNDSKCPMCLQCGPVAMLCMGMEPAFWVDMSNPTHAFYPCGHMASEKTCKFWSNRPIPHGLNGFDSVCPFCLTQLIDYPGYVKLIFQ